MPEEKKWVYKANWDFTLNIKPSQVKIVIDSVGNNQKFTEKPVNVKFVNGFLTVTEAFAKRYGLPIETLVEWIEMQPSFNSRFWLVQSPEKAASKEEVAKMEEAGGVVRNKMVQRHGPRTTGG